MRKIEGVVLEHLAAGALSKDLALLLLQAAQAPLSATEKSLSRASGSGIAIIGMSCRVAGADNLDEFWANMVDRRDVLAPFPQRRAADYVRAKRHLFDRFGEQLSDQSLWKSRTGYFRENLDSFDAEFFAITPAEADLMDPRHRVFFEVAHEALEHACLTRDKLHGSRAGIYVAFNPHSDDEYAALCNLDEPSIGVANIPANIGYRLAYLLNTRGPTLTVDTTCSSSAVAIHLACQAIRAGDCDTALVGAAYAPLFPYTREKVRVGLESGDGRCRVFDAGATGTTFGEGFAAIVLKDFEVAGANGDRVLAVIKGTAVGSDGRSNSVTAPNPDAQTDVILRAWADANINAETISYIEAHGTATRLGDPIEIQALTEAFARHTPKRSFCAIGSAKSNVGHTADAAGLVGVIKVVLSMVRGELPPLLHFEQPNPLISFERSAIFVNNARRPWTSEADVPRRAGVSSFGISGTNVHIVLEQPDVADYRPPVHGKNWVLAISALGNASLWQLLMRYERFLILHNDIRIEDLCYTAALHRDHYSRRVAIVAASRDELVSKIQRLIGIRNFEEIPSNFETDGIFFRKIQAPLLSRPVTLIDHHQRSAAVDYVNGGIPDWSMVFAETDCRKSELPLYAFQVERHWPRLEAGEVSSTDNLFHDLLWLERPAPPAYRPQVGSDVGIWLIFCDPLGIGQELGAVLERAGHRIVRFTPSLEPTRSSELDFRVRPGVAEDLEWALATLADGHGPLDVAGVVHLWTCDVPRDEMADLYHVVESQKYGVMTLFNLARSLLSRMQRRDMQWNYVTAYAKDVGGRVCGAPIIPARTTGAGLIRVLSQENPWIGAYCFDVDPLNSSVSEIAGALLAEMMVERRHREQVIGYRHGRRYVQVLDRADSSTLAVPTNEGQRGEGGLFQQGANYLIAGGLGFLGIELGKFISSNVSVNLVMLNRSSLPRREEWSVLLNSHDCDPNLRHKLEGILEIERRGSNILCLSADVTNSAELDRAVDIAVTAFGPVSGVVVAMKHLFHKRIDELTEKEFGYGIANRVSGTWLLERATRSAHRSIFLILSSISSVLGAKGASECCSVNQYLDSFGPFLRRHGIPAQVLNLTLVQGNVREIIGETPIPPIGVEQFCEAAQTIVKADMPFAAVAKFNAGDIRFLLPVIKIRFSDELLARLGVTDTALAALDTTERAIRDVDVLQSLRLIWKEVLGYEQVPIDANFFELGGTSLSVLKLAKLVRERVDSAFDVTDVYGSPTIGSLKRLIEGRRKGPSKGLRSVVDHGIENKLSELLAGVSSSDIDVEHAIRQFEMLRG